MQGLINRLAGDRNQKQLKKLYPLVEQINQLDAQRDELSDEEIQNKTAIFKTRLGDGESVDDLLVEAFTVVKQACKRLCGQEITVKEHTMFRNMIPYDVQLLGGIILHKWNIAEMRTGEGKTLVATLPAYLNALTWKGVHVVTVNDYLASRDAERMGHLYQRLWLAVGVVTKQTGHENIRKEQYEKDITYVENSELGFDYLRDNLTVSWDQRALTRRPLNFAIVDEVDSILIDEARTPMIISQASGEPTEKYEYYAKLVQLLTPSKGKKKVSKGFLQELLHDPTKESADEEIWGDYRIDEKTKTVTLSSEGIQKLEELLKVENLYRDIGYQEIHHIENALKAQAVYTKDKEYLIRESEILLVDEHTGRVMPGRRYSEGLHQAIEAKEQVTIQRESKTLATITYQHFFKLYTKLAGMTGTALTEGEEFEKIYELLVLSVPTHRPIIRVDKNDMVYFNQDAKRKAVTDHIKFYHQIGVPLLIGTSSIETSELVSSLLRKMALPHNVLNAKYHEQEANIVMNAGKKSSVVVATNMAWRGTDIKLEEGLLPKLAIGYANRVQMKLKAGTSVSWVVYSEKEFDLTIEALKTAFELTDEQVRQAEKPAISFDQGTLKIKFNTSKKERNQAYAELVLEPAIPAEKSLREEKDFHYGLYILGTEKHDSRRIDNQLRGRTGRQWDPGISQFFVAMDDEIMRKMGGDKIQSIARMMLKAEDLENLAFTQKQFTNSIQRAQKQMEGWHFGIRKHLFEYDSVIDKQRVRIYAKRDAILQRSTEEVSDSDNQTFPKDQKTKQKDQPQVIELDVLDEVKSFVDEVIENLVTSFTAVSPWQLGELTEELNQITGASFLEEEFAQLSSARQLQELIKEKMHTLYTTIISQVDTETAQDVCRRIYLSVIDRNWIEHITDMHYLREKVWLYGYAQIDPLVIYKKEAFEKFQRLLFTIKKETLAQVMRYDFAGQANAQQLAQQITQETQGEVDMMAMLKAVTKGLQITANPVTQSPMPVKEITLEGWEHARVMEDKDGIEVIEVDDLWSTTTSTAVDLSGTKSKIRPNDKVTIQYADGKVEYGVKRKKVKEQVESWKAKVVG